MKKLILGIVGVLILQSAFVALTTSDKAHEVAVKDLASGLGSDPLFGLIADKGAAPDLSTPIFADDIAALEAPASRVARSRPTAATRRIGETLARSEPVQASHSDDKIIILYDRQPETIDAVAANDAVVVKEKPRTETPRTEGKSLLAKAAPIIQKPYDWLKSFASKLK